MTSTTQNGKVAHASVFNGLATLDLVKHGTDSWQFHRLEGDRLNPDPLHGQSEEHDRLTAAFTELHYLDQKIRAEVAEIFARHGLSDHGFAGALETRYIPDWDRT
jgi:hypothetical protein